MAGPLPCAKISALMSSGLISGTSAGSCNMLVPLLAARLRAPRVLAAVWPRLLCSISDRAP